MGGAVGEHEADPFAGRHGELGEPGGVVERHGDVGGEPGRVGPGDGGDLPVLAADPRLDAAVAEAQPHHGAHGDAAADAFDDADDVGDVVARGHGVEDADGALGGLPLGLEDERVAAVAPPRAGAARGGGQEPRAVLLVAEEGGEARGRVESGQAQPVDGTVGAHQCRGVQVAEHSVVFDPQSHISPSHNGLAHAAPLPITPAGRR